MIRHNASWTKGEEERLINMAKKNYSNEEISKELQRSIHSVAQRKRALGIKVARNSWSKHEEQTIISMYKQGYKVQEVADRIGRSYSATAARASKLGISKSKAPQENTRDSIKDKIEKTVSKLKVGKKYKVVDCNSDKRITDKEEIRILTYKGSSKDLLIFESENYKETFRKLDLANGDLRIKEADVDKSRIVS